MPADEKPSSSAARPGASASELEHHDVKFVGQGMSELPACGETEAPGEHARVPEAFLALASHELRMPLHAMGLQVEMLRVRIAQSSGKVPAPWVLERLEGMEKLLKRARRLIENLLGVSEIALGRHVLRRERFDLAELAEEVLSGNAEALRWAGCPCAFERAGPVVGLWDRARIERVLENLLVNAMKYAAGAPIEVRVWAEGPTAFLSVRDEGPGIAAADHERVFQRFARAAHCGSVEGFGLGLWVVKTIAEEHGGSVELDSAPRAGARFTIRLPGE
jgi:signal transduction histidine kinase